MNRKQEQFYVVKWLSGQLYGEEKRALKANVKDHPESKTEIQQLKETWKQLGVPDKEGEKLYSNTELSKDTTRPMSSPSRRENKFERNTWMRSGIAAATVVLLLVLAGITYSVYYGPDRTSAKAIATVKTESSEMTLVRKGETVLVQPSTKLRQNDRIVLKESENVTFQHLDEASRITLKENTEVTLSSNEHTKRIHMKHGTLKARISSTRKSMNLIVTSPLGQVEVKGTSFTFSSNDTARLRVTDGKVQFRGRQSEKYITVRKGEHAEIASPTDVPEKKKTPIEIADPNRSNQMEDLEYTTTWLGDTADASKKKWIQNWVNDLAVWKDGTVYTNATWDEHKRTTGVYREGDPVETHHLYQENPSGRAIAIDKNYIYVQRSRDNWQGIKVYNRTGDKKYTPYKFKGGPDHSKFGDGVHTQNFLPVGKEAKIFGMAHGRDKLYVSELPDSNIHVYDTRQMKKVDTFGDFLDTEEKTTHPLELEVGPDGNIWNIQATLERTYERDSGVSVTAALSTSDDMRAGNGIHVAYVPVKGDAEITARVHTVRPESHKDPLVGVILLDELEKGTPFAWMRLINHKTSRFIRRKNEGGNISWAGQGDLSETPVSYRLRKKGDEVVCWESSDGENWTTVGKDNRTRFEGTNYIGLAVRSYSMSEPSTALFKNVTINGDPVPFDQFKSTDIGDAKISGNIENGLRMLKNMKVTRQIREYSSDGAPTGKEITSVPMASDLAFHPDGRLFVTDDGPDQQIKTFNVSGVHPQQVGTMGPKSGVFSGTPGKYGPYKLNGPNAIDITENGNIYVASGGKTDPWDRRDWGMWSNWHTDLRAFSGTDREGGELLWKALGLMFVDTAVADPRSHSDIYTMETHMEVDWTKQPGDEGYEPGGEWDETYDQIHNGFKYPDDVRHRWGGTTPIAIRYIGGEPFMYTTNMRTKFLAAFRLRAEGEVSAPSAMVVTSPRSDTWPAEALRKPGRGMVPWLWKDQNGDGSMQKEEFEESRLSSYPASAGGWDVDAEGAIWHCSGDGIERLPVKKLNGAKAPDYDMQAMEEYEYPEPFKQVRQVEYDANEDVLYMMGYTKDHPEPGNDWKAAGTVLARYDGWLNGSRSLAWKKAVPYTSDHNTSGFCHDGAGWLYVGYGDAPQRGLVKVYSGQDGRLLGDVTPGSNVGEVSGLLDVVHPVRAFKRENGERILMVEEDALGRILVYRIRRRSK